MVRPVSSESSLAMISPLAISSSVVADGAMAMMMGLSGEPSGTGVGLGISVGGGSGVGGTSVGFSVGGAVVGGAAVGVAPPEAATRRANTTSPANRYSNRFLDIFSPPER